MPTDLPVRSHAQTQVDDWSKCGQSLLRFYGSAALAVLLLISIERRLGIFDGLTVTESICKAAEVQFRNDRIDPFWASSPPL